MNTEHLAFEERLRACETQLETCRGQLKGMEYALRLVMAIGGNPNQLAQAWQLLLPSIVDTHASKESYGFTSALQQKLTEISVQLEDACRPLPKDP